MVIQDFAINYLSWKRGLLDLAMIGRLGSDRTRVTNATMCWNDDDLVDVEMHTLAKEPACSFIRSFVGSFYHHHHHFFLARNRVFRC